MAFNSNISAGLLISADANVEGMISWFRDSTKVDVLWIVKTVIKN